MALDTTNLTKFLKGITDAIRAKTGSTDPIKHNTIDEEIKNIKTIRDNMDAISEIINCRGARTDFSYACVGISRLINGNDYANLKINTSNGQIFDYMFYSSNVISTPKLYTAGGTSFRGMFGYSSCETINGELTLKNLKIGGLYNMFVGCTQLKTVRFVKDSIDLMTLDMKYCKDLTTESIDSIINGLSQNTSVTNLTLRLHSDVIDKLTDEQLLKIANKNWQLG